MEGTLGLCVPGDPWKFLEQISLASTEPWKPSRSPPKTPALSAVTVRKPLATGEDTVVLPSKGSPTGPRGSPGSPLGVGAGMGSALSTVGTHGDPAIQATLPEPRGTRGAGGRQELRQPHQERWSWSPEAHGAQWAELGRHRLRVGCTSRHYSLRTAPCLHPHHTGLLLPMGPGAWTLISLHCPFV